jgi:hypothetical protein
MLNHRFRDPIAGAAAAIAAGLNAVMLATAKWLGTNSRGNQLTTELNSLANGAFSAVGPAYDNTANLDEYGYVDITLASLLPTTGGNIQIYLAVSIDGTTYEDAPSSTNPGAHQLVAVVSVNVTTSAKRVSSKRFEIPPLKFKFVVKNQSGVALAASGNTVALTTDNEQVT